MTKQEIIEILKPFENKFHLALDLQITRGLSKKEAEILSTTYKEATGKDLKINNSCAVCIYNALITVGKLYRSVLKASETPSEASNDEKVDNITTEHQKRPQKRQKKVTTKKKGK